MLPALYSHDTTFPFLFHPLILSQAVFFHPLPERHPADPEDSCRFRPPAARYLKGFRDCHRCIADLVDARKDTADGSYTIEDN